MGWWDLGFKVDKGLGLRVSGHIGSWVWRSGYRVVCSFRLQGFRGTGIHTLGFPIVGWVRAA